MKAKLVLTVAAQRIGLELVRPVATNGFQKLLGQLAGAANLPSPIQAFERIAQLTAPVSTAPKAVADALEEAWQRLNPTDGVALQVGDMEVELGATHSRLGLMHLANAGAGAANRHPKNVMASAWVRQIWNIDPATQVMRWRAFGIDSTKLLVSCIDRQVFNDLEGFARQHGLRFTSCLPALSKAFPCIGVPDHPTSQLSGINGTLVWTEASDTLPRAPLVQLVRLEGGQPQAFWRGWLAPPLSSDTTDVALQGAVRRFHAFCKLPPAEPVRTHRWPETSAFSPASNVALNGRPMHA